MKSYIAFTFSVACLTAALGWAVGVNRGLAIGEVRVAAARETAYKQGLSDANLRDLINEDHNLVRKVCTTWWFDMTGVERKLK